MKQMLLPEQHPAFRIEIPKAETRCASVAAIIAALAARIAETPNAAEIAALDRHAQTRGLDDEMHPDFVAAKNRVLRSGYKPPDPTMLSVRPRAIGLADMTGRFVVSVLEAPMAIADTTMAAGR